MNNFDSFKIKNPAMEVAQKMQGIGALAAIREMQKSTAFSAAMKIETSSAFDVMRELQKTINAARMPLNQVNAVLGDYQELLSPITRALTQINNAFAPSLMATKAFDTIKMSSLVIGLKTSSAAMNAVSNLNLTGLAGIIDSLPKQDFLSDINTDDFSVKEAERLFENGEITQEDINDEFVDIVTNKKFSPKEEWDKIQKSKCLKSII